MPRLRAALALVLLSLCLSGCREDDALSELETAVNQLQDNLQAKRNSAVLKQLELQFLAQQRYDRDWAKRTMALLYLKHKNVRIMALSKHSELDKRYPHIGHTQASVALTGAEGLIPNSASHYQVTLQWWREDGQWKLARLDWQ